MSELTPMSEWVGIIRAEMEKLDYTPISDEELEELKFIRGNSFEMAGKYAEVNKQFDQMVFDLRLPYEEEGIATKMFTKMIVNNSNVEDAQHT